jgi:hypothetical protein
MRDLIAASFLALGFSVIGSSCVRAQTAEQQCSHEWQALKSSGNTHGWTEPAFMAGCKNHHTFSTNPSGLGSPEPTPTQASANGKTASQCATDYAANKAASRHQVRRSGRLSPLVGTAADGNAAARLRRCAEGPIAAALALAAGSP